MCMLTEEKSYNITAHPPSKKQMPLHMNLTQNVLPNRNTPCSPNKKSNKWQKNASYHRDNCTCFGQH